jgi:hypothetical protein
MDYTLGSRRAYGSTIQTYFLTKSRKATGMPKQTRPTGRYLNIFANGKSPKKLAIYKKRFRATATIIPKTVFLQYQLN